MARPTPPGKRTRISVLDAVVVIVVVIGGVLAIIRYNWLAISRLAHSLPNVNSQIVGEWKSTRGPEHLVGSGHCGSTDAGSTHAWAEVYVPGAGWITFDPTNRSVGGFNLIPVAVARDIRQAMPVAGTTDAFQGMSVGVLITV